jgi:hypothetical protein
MDGLEQLVTCGSGKMQESLKVKKQIEFILILRFYLKTKKPRNSAGTYKNSKTSEICAATRIQSLSAEKKITKNHDNWAGGLYKLFRIPRMFSLENFSYVNEEGSG